MRACVLRGERRLRTQLPARAGLLTRWRLLKLHIDLLSPAHDQLRRRRLLRWRLPAGRSMHVGRHWIQLRCRRSPAEHRLCRGRRGVAMLLNLILRRGVHHVRRRHRLHSVRRGIGLCGLQHRRVPVLLLAAAAVAASAARPISADTAIPPRPSRWSRADGASASRPAAACAHASAAADSPGLRILTSKRHMRGDAA